MFSIAKILAFSKTAKSQLQRWHHRLYWGGVALPSVVLAWLSNFRLVLGAKLIFGMVQDSFSDNLLLGGLKLLFLPIFLTFATLFAYLNKCLNLFAGPSIDEFFESLHSAWFLLSLPVGYCIYQARQEESFTALDTVFKICFLHRPLGVNRQEADALIDFIEKLQATHPELVISSPQDELAFVEVCLAQNSQDLNSGLVKMLHDQPTFLQAFETALAQQKPFPLRDSHTLLWQAAKKCHTIMILNEDKAQYKEAYLAQMQNTPSLLDDLNHSPHLIEYLKRTKAFA